jgi:hypothetical protein
MDLFDRDTIDSLRSCGVSNHGVRRVELMRESAYLAGRRDGLKVGAVDLLNQVDKALLELDASKSYSPFDIHMLILKRGFQEIEVSD